MIKEFKLTCVQQVVIVDVQLSELVSFDESLFLVIRHERHHEGYSAIKELTLEVYVDQSCYQVDLLFHKHLELPKLDLGYENNNNNSHKLLN